MKISVFDTFITVIGNFCNKDRKNSKMKSEKIL